MIGAELLYDLRVLSFNVITVPVRQTVTPNRFARSDERKLSDGAVRHGAARLGIGGVLGQHFGLRTALVIAVLAFPSAVLWTISSPVVRMREMSAGPAEDLLAAPAAGPSSPAADEPVTSRSMEMESG